tara:strand:+ start:49 stop:351 length:303 start_codon:yes stop_codon:yes gene_type:complete
MNKQENNKLIAEFMGVEPQFINKEYEMYGVIECIDDGENEQHFFYPKEMLFHESWDWLMPVALRIVEKHGWDCIAKRDSLNKVYQAVVEFIKANKKEAEK